MLQIKHLLKAHCAYTGLICPYCRGHHPERYLDLQSHVTSKHMDQLTGYNVTNACKVNPQSSNVKERLWTFFASKVCKKSFTGYAELRDHVQIHGDAYRDPYGNPEAYKEYAKKRKWANGQWVPGTGIGDFLYLRSSKDTKTLHNAEKRWEDFQRQQQEKQGKQGEQQEPRGEEQLEQSQQQPQQLDTSISSVLLDEIISACNEGEGNEQAICTKFF